nr:uncharacterized protein DKFZp434B061-like [Penaeus vannamei]
MHWTEASPQWHPPRQSPQWLLQALPPVALPPRMVPDLGGSPQAWSSSPPVGSPQESPLVPVPTPQAVPHWLPPRQSPPLAAPQAVAPTGPPPRPRQSPTGSPPRQSPALAPPRESAPVGSHQAVPPVAPIRVALKPPSCSPPPKQSPSGSPGPAPHWMPNQLERKKK